MKFFAVYDSSGRILRCGSGQEDIAKEQALDGEFVILGDEPFNDATQYVLDGVVIDRPILDLRPSKTNVVADGQDVSSMSVPKNAEVFIEAPWYRVSIPEHEGLIDLSCDWPGRYVVTVRAFPYQDAIVAIHAS